MDHITSNFLKAVFHRFYLVEPKCASALYALSTVKYNVNQERRHNFQSEGAYKNILFESA